MKRPSKSIKIRILDSFYHKLNEQVDFIAQDKPSAARKFKKDVIQHIRGLLNNPFRCRKSIYAEDENIRDLVFKGYVITYRIDPTDKLITVFALHKYEDHRGYRQ